MRARVILLTIVGILVAACTPAPPIAGVPNGDRIPDSLVARGTAQCATQTGDTMTREDRTALCGCMFREMQRTMRMQEMTDIAEAAKASGGDEAARTHLFFSNEKIRNSLAKCIQDFGHSPAAGSSTPITGSSLVDCTLRDGTTFTTTAAACDRENTFHYRDRILQDREEVLRTGKRTPEYPCTRLAHATTQAICEARGGTSALPSQESDVTPISNGTLGYCYDPHEKKFVRSRIPCPQLQ
jgi:hypothetical protein